MSSVEVDDDDAEEADEGDEEASSAKTCPPLDDEISCTTAPSEPSFTKIVTFMTGSMSTAGEAEHALRSEVVTAVRAAMDIAVGVVSGSKCCDASRSM